MSCKYGRLWPALIALMLVILVSGCGQERSKAANTKRETAAATKKADAGKSGKKQAKGGKPGTSPLQPGITPPLPIAGGGLGSVADSFLGGGNTLTAPSTTPAVPGIKTAPGRAAPPPKIQPGKRPTPVQLLQVVQANYKSLKSLKLARTQSDIASQDGKTVAQQKNAKSIFLFKRPNKFVVRASDSATYCDGTNVYEYSSQAKRYVKGKMSDDVIMQMVMGKPGISIVGLIMGLDYTPHVKSSKLLGDSKVGSKDTYVLSLDLKGQPGATINHKLWIGKKDYGIYKEEMQMKMVPQAPQGYKGKLPKSMQLKSFATYTEYAPNATIADSSFTFKPPADAKLLDPKEMMKKPEPLSLLDKHAPDFSFKWTDGTAKKLSDFRGRVVVLDFWAIPQAEAHLPVLHSANKTAKEGVQVISVCLSNDEDKIKSYLEGKGFSFPVVMATRDMAKTIMSDYRIMSVPTIYVIDKQGIVRRQIHGNVPESDLQAKINKVLAM